MCSAEEHFSGWGTERKSSLSFNSATSEKPETSSCAS